MKTLKLTDAEVQFLVEGYEVELLTAEKHLEYLRGILEKLTDSRTQKLKKIDLMEPKKRGRKPKREPKPVVKKGKRGRKPKVEKVETDTVAVKKEPKKKIASKTFKKGKAVIKDKKKLVVSEKSGLTPKKVASKPVKSKQTKTKPVAKKVLKSKKAPLKKITPPFEAKTVEPKPEVVNQPINPTT